MSRLRVPFRTKQSSSQLNEPITSPPVEFTPEPEPVTIQVDHGKESDVERLWGLENFGNTCYCNSVLQALYACEPFRQFVASYPDPPAPITPMAPAPGEVNKARPSSPLAIKTGNPFDSPKANADKKAGGLFARRPPPLPTSTTPAPVYAPILTSRFDTPPANPNPSGPPPSVFETIQTLFHHLSSSLPHQPLPAKKDAKANPENAQTASLLPSEEEPAASPNPNAPPPGPPLLASLPPPSAPRGGGPFQAGTLGRGVVRPEDLLKTVKRENEMFRGMSQQDAHEFLGWVLNKVSEDIDVVDRSLRDVGKGRPAGKSFVQNLFEGTLTNETRCLSCETVGLQSM
jgi:ubiquitin carboxyl-terminal hydrolase 9/13